MPTDSIVSIGTLSDLTHEDLDHIGPHARTFALQLDASKAQRHYEFTVETIGQELDRLARQSKGIGPMGDVWDHPEVVEARKQAEQARETARQAQAEVGGLVACVVAENLEKLHKKAAALTKRAERIGQEPITVTDTDEKIALNYAYGEGPGYSLLKADFEHTFVVITGGAPRVPGFTFLATLDHTENGTIIKRVSPWALSVRLNLQHDDHQESQSEAERVMDSIDLTKYHTADPRECDQCHKNRNRKHTYVAYNHATGETKRVGKECLRDYTGIDDPERVAKAMESYWEFLRFSSSKGETPAVRTITFLTHAAALYRREAGYFKGLGWEALRNLNDKIDQRTYEGTPQWVEPTEGDQATAERILAWARNEWTDTSEFATNVKISLAGPVLPEKAFGIAGAVYAARDRQQRDAEKLQERERQAQANAQSQWVGEEKQRLIMTLTVDKIRWIESFYAVSGTKPLIIMHDENGNAVKWFASDLPEIPVEVDPDTDALPYVTPIEGGTYEVKVTVKKHDDHEQYGKSTIVSRAKFLAIISEPNTEEE